MAVRGAAIAFAFGDLGVCRAAGSGDWAAVAAPVCTTTTTTAALLYDPLHPVPGAFEEPDGDPQAAGYAKGLPGGVPGAERLAGALIFAFCE